MRTTLKGLYHELMHPEVSSSVLPLLIVTITFAAISTAIIIALIKMLKSSRNKASGPTPINLGVGSFIFEKLFTRGAGFPKPPFAQSKEPRSFSAADLEELNALRAQVAKLENENRNLREQVANFLNRFEERKQEIGMMEERHLADTRALEAMNLQRVKAQQRAAEIENQLKDIITEVERLYRANAQAAELQKVSGRLGTLIKDFDRSEIAAQVPPPDRGTAREPDSAEALKAKDEQIRQLKDLLKVCKEQILEIKRNGESKAA